MDVIFLKQANIVSFWIFIYGDAHEELHVTAPRLETASFVHAVLSVGGRVTGMWPERLYADLDSSNRV